MRIALTLLAVMTGGCASIAGIDDLTYVSAEAGQGPDRADVGADVEMSRSDTGVEANAEVDAAGVDAAEVDAGADAGDGRVGGPDAPPVCGTSGAACTASTTCCASLTCATRA